MEGFIVRTFRNKLIVPLLAALSLCLFPLCAKAAPGDVLSGEYVLIVNTDLSDSTEDINGNYIDVPQKSGTTYFDASAGSVSNGIAAMDASTPPMNTLSVVSSGLVLPDSSGFVSPLSSDAFVSAASYTPGQTKYISGKSFTLAAIGEHCLIWMDDSIKNGYVAAGKDIYAIGAAAADIYDEKSYPVITHFDATDLLFYADGSAKLSILFESGISSGYFDYSDTWEDNGQVTAIHINASKLPSDLSGFAPLFAHECQHALNYSTELYSNFTSYMKPLAQRGAFHSGNGHLPVSLHI